jgi:TP901-1 family phage major tail protein
MASIIKGSNLMLFVKVGSDYKSIGYATNHTLQIGSESSSISTKDDLGGGALWVQSSINKLNWSISTDNLFSYDAAGQEAFDLITLMTSRTLVEVCFAIAAETSVPATGWTPDDDISHLKGSAYISDLSINSPNGDNASFSATFSGVGQLTPIVA